MYGITTLVLGALVISGPLTVLLDRFIPDDAFYYYNTARIFAQTGYSSFDGIHFTNGYQPLWFLVGVPIFKLFPDGGEQPLRLLLFIQLGLSLASTIILIRSVAKLFGIIPAAFAGVLWVVVFQRTMLNGLETSLQMFLYALLFHRFTSKQPSANGLRTPKEYFELGVLSGLAFLARVDLGFVVAAIVIHEIIDIARSREPPSKKVTYLSLVIAPTLVISGSYLLMNYLSTGSIMPVSGAAKQFHSDVGRQLAIQNADSSWSVYLQNLIWPTSSRTYNFVLIGLLGPYLLLALSWIPALSGTLSHVRRIWPFYLGATMSYLFYALIYYGGHTSTFWYYGPLAFLAFLTLAGLSCAIDLLPPFRKVLGLSSVLLIGLTLGWIGPRETALAIIFGILVSWIGGRAIPRSVVARRVSLGIVMVGLLGFLSLRSVNLQTWLLIILGTVILGAMIYGDKVGRVRATYSVAMVLVATVAVHLTNVVSDLKTAPGNWNFNLYQGALWAKQHLPATATIWSGSAGILGYFSDHSVVNTDGLANDYDFLESVLKQGQLVEYYREWDYAIDAFPDETLASIFPEGCFVKLPEGITQFGFADGELTRRLRVFQMRSSGPLECDGAR